MLPWRNVHWNTRYEQCRSVVDDGDRGRGWDDDGDVDGQENEQNGLLGHDCTVYCICTFYDTRCRVWEHAHAQVEKPWQQVDGCTSYTEGGI